MSETSFGELGGWLGALAEQQTDLETAVESGQLWMKAGVAREAATRCEQAADELDEWLADTYELVQRRKFGANEDGEAAAARFVTAGQEYVQVVTDARKVFQRMADTYRAAGGDDGAGGGGRPAVVRGRGVVTGRSMRCRALLAVTTVAVLGGCAGDISGAPSTSDGPSGGDRPTMDPCAVLSDAELAQLGRQPETRRTVQELDAIGCGWRGQPFGLTLTTNPDTIAAYRERKDDPVFVSFAENQVNDRPGVQTQVATSGEQCAQAVGTGSGVLSVGVSLSARASVDGVQVDPCAEALRIAELIEPRIPEAGS